MDNFFFPNKQYHRSILFTINQNKKTISSPVVLTVFCRHKLLQSQVQESSRNLENSFYWLFVTEKSLNLIDAAYVNVKQWTYVYNAEFEIRFLHLTTCHNKSMLHNCPETSFRFLLLSLVL